MNFGCTKLLLTIKTNKTFVGNKNSVHGHVAVARGQEDRGNLFEKKIKIKNNLLPSVDCHLYVSHIVSEMN